MVRSGSLFALVFLVFVTSTGYGIFLPIFPFFAMSTGATPMAVILALGIFSLGQFLAAPLWGRLSDRFGRKPVLIAGILGITISYLLLAQSDDVWEMGGARLFAGLMAGNGAAAFAAAADMADERTRARNMGLLGAAQSFAFVIGPAIGAALVGRTPDEGGFRLVCYVSAAFATLAALTTFFLFHETRARTAPSAHLSRTSRWLLLAGRPALTFFIATTLFLLAAHALFVNALGLWVYSKFRWGPYEVGWMFGAMAGGSALLQGGAVGHAARMIGERTLLLTGLVLFSLGLALMAAAQVPWVACFGMGALTVGISAASPAVQSLVAGQTQQSERGAVMGISQSASALGQMLGTILCGAVFQFWGPDAPYILGALTLALLAVGVLVLPAAHGTSRPSTAGGDR